MKKKFPVHIILVNVRFCVSDNVHNDGLHGVGKRNNPCRRPFALRQQHVQQEPGTVPVGDSRTKASSSSISRSSDCDILSVVHNWSSREYIRLCCDNQEPIYAHRHELLPLQLGNFRFESSNTR